MIRGPFCFWPLIGTASVFLFLCILIRRLVSVGPNQALWVGFWNVVIPYSSIATQWALCLFLIIENMFSFQIMLLFGYSRFVVILLVHSKLYVFWIIVQLYIYIMLFTLWLYIYQVVCFMHCCGIIDIIVMFDYIYLSGCCRSVMLSVMALLLLIYIYITRQGALLRLYYSLVGPFLWDYYLF